MNGKVRIRTVALVALAMSAAASHAQCHQPRDTWLMKNYNFAGPPAPNSYPNTDPVVSQLQEIQNTLLSIMRKADFGDDFDTVLAAASQAADNAQLIGVITQRLQSATIAQMSRDQANAATASYSIAFQNHTVETAAAYWTDGLMLHYLTPQGAHVQVRLDLVDRDASIRLNRAKNLEFNLHQ